MKKTLIYTNFDIGIIYFNYKRKQYEFIFKTVDVEKFVFIEFSLK